MSKSIRIASRDWFRCFVAVVAAGGATAISTQLTSGQSSAPPMTTIAAAEIQRVVESAKGAAGAQQLKVVDLGKYNVAVTVLRRGPTQAGGPVGALMHEKVSEVFYVVSGSGTLVVGGEVVNVKPMAADSLIVTTLEGPSSSGTFKQPAMSRKLSAGDIAIVPAGVFHNFIEIADHIEYLSIKPDLEKVLPAGYVNPVLKD